MPFSTNKNQQSVIEQAKRNSPYYQSVIDSSAVSEFVPGVYPVTLSGGILDLGAGSQETLTGIGAQIAFETGNAAGTVVSSSGLDDFGNTGANLLELVSMTQAGVLQFETVTMDGASNVALANQAARIVQARVVATGNAGSNQGIITITLGSAQLAIAPNANLATGAILTVPADHVFILDSVSFASEDPAGVGLLVHQTGIGDATTALKTRIETLTSPFTNKTINYKPIPAGDSIFMDAANFGAAAANVSGGFSGVLYAL